MSKRRVVISGLGIINALGADKDEYFNGLLEGKVGIDRIKSFDPVSFSCQVGGEAPEVKVNKFLPKSHRKAAKLMSRDIIFAVIATDSAMKDAGLKTRADNPDGPIDIEPTRSGVNIGAGTMCCDLEELTLAACECVDGDKFDMKKWGAEGMNNLTPLWMLKYLPNMPSCHISIIYDLQGPSNAITSGEVSGMLAINEAYRHIASDKADIMITGGAENRINAMGQIRHCLMDRLNTKDNDNPAGSCRPFDANANGVVQGDGGAMVILEEYQRATQRGAEIYAELKGFGSSYNQSNYIDCEADGKGCEIAMQAALNQAGLKPEDIDLIIPNGIGRIADDKAEATAIKKVFGELAGEIPVLATKSRIGICGAGASAIDFATAALIIKNGKVPANINCDNQSLGLNMPTTVTEAEIKNVLVTCYSHGGQTAAAVIGK
ncbi:MAG: beta-ketoacyl-[acyl-carrier-protein] synthase family protein [Phycisphaerae bacterium]|nr:beta-ketoacyl-[acyl-carrier-protein] synthase family protein [Phycisphaerae bacterium]